MLQQPAIPPHPLIQQSLPQGFCYLDEVLPQLLFDARYATERNFTGEAVPGYERNRIALSEAMVAPLEQAEREAEKRGLRLLVWDAARPTRAVSAFVLWATSDVQAEEDGQDPLKQAHYPHIRRSDMLKDGYVARKSGHSRGAAIDLTLVDGETLVPLDMGTDFDFMDPLSHHGAGGLSDAQAQNREILAQLMESCGFLRYKNEWWHYRLKKEPFPDTYFDFSIS